MDSFCLNAKDSLLMMFDGVVWYILLNLCCFIEFLMPVARRNTYSSCLL